jgi:RimJ/RimL family protein N-acetyltransferase
MSVLLETDRLVLRRFTEDDAPLLFDLDSDPEVMRYVGPYRLPSVEAYRDRIRDAWLPAYAARPDRGVFAAFLKDAGEFLGWFAYRPATAYRFAAEAGWTRDTDVELGYRLRRAHWNKGFATEGSLALVQLGLADPDVTGVVAAALLPNRASTRVMEKCGLAWVRQFAVPGFDDPLVVYARCKAGCAPPATA